MTLRAPLMAVLALLAACSPMAADAGERQRTTTAPRHPQSGLEIVPLTVTHAGREHRFRVEVARTAAEQAKGLMFRTAMGADEGMLFLRNPPDVPSFWMRNTVIPLDLIFIGSDRRILNIAADAVPYDETPLTARGVSIAVLELNGGRAAQLGLAPGDKVEW
ncbi:MAG: DUF192 domain-containing protein [Novosphingobium sp.]|nr:DUF192 domain-containing protein [Novosphingobium sp.]